MEPDIGEMTRSIYRERVERARRMSPEQKFAAGPELFEMACQVTLDGIRHDHPDYSDAEARAELRRRLELRERREYCPLMSDSSAREPT